MSMGHLFRRFELWKTDSPDRRSVRALRRSSRTPDVSDTIESLEDRRLLSATNFVPFIGPQMAPAVQLPTGAAQPAAAANVQEFNGHYTGEFEGTLTIRHGGTDNGTYNFTGNVDITVKDGHVTLKVFALVNSTWRLNSVEEGTIDRFGTIRVNGQMSLTIPGENKVLHSPSNGFAVHTSQNGGTFSGTLNARGAASGETFTLSTPFHANRV